MPLSQVQFQKLRDKGLSPRQIANFEAGQTPQTQPAPEKEKGFFGRIGSDLQQRGANIQNIFGRTFRGEINPLEASVQTVGQAAAGVTDVGGEALITGFKKAAEITEPLDEQLQKLAPIKREQFKNILNSEVGKAGLDALGKGADAYNEWKSKNERTAANLEAVVNIGLLIPEAKVAKSVFSGGRAVGKELIREIPKVAEDVVKAGRQGIKDVAKKRTTSVLKTIEERIAPKLTSKVSQGVIKSGRVASGQRGKIAGKLFGDKPAVVTGDRAIKRAAKTVERRIKNVDKLDDFQLVNESTNQISSISNKLKPQLQTVQVAPKNVSKIESIWNKLKRSQASGADFQNNAGSRAIQRKFDNVISELKRGIKDTKTGKFRQKNLDDIWELRKDFDGGIADRVKQATSQSDAFLQLQKEMWLQNRNILNDVIDDMAKQLNIASRQSFDDMADLYRVVNNIATKTKIDVKGTPGLIRKNLKRGVIIGGGGAAIGAGSELFK